MLRDINLGMQTSAAALLLFYYYAAYSAYLEVGMTDKELRRLTRFELLQMLIEQVEENSALQDKLAQAESELKDRQIRIDNAGSLAEASLSLNGVFKAAEEAAQQYLENIRRMSDNQESICRDMKLKAEKEASEIVKEAQAYSQKMHEEADDYLKQMKYKAATILQNKDALRELILSARKKEPK